MVEGDDDTVPSEPEAAIEEDALTVDRRARRAVATLEEEIDPKVAFRSSLLMQDGDWYVVHSYSGHEKRVKQAIEHRVVSLNMEDYIFQVEVPMEEVVEYKNGQKKQVTRVRMPGYVLVRMDLGDASWGAVRNTPGVTGFVGHAHQPVPLTPDEVYTMLAPSAPVTAAGDEETRKSGPQVELDFQVGEAITVIDGPFATLPGTHFRDQRGEPEAPRSRFNLRPRNSGRALVRAGSEDRLGVPTGKNDTTRRRKPPPLTQKDPNNTMAPPKKKVAGLIKLQIRLVPRTRLRPSAPHWVSTA